MNKKLAKNENIREFVAYLIVAAITTVLLIRLYHLYNADLNVPYSYSGDGMLWTVDIKNYINGGGLYYYPQLGAPFIAKFTTLPNFNLLYSLILLLLAHVSSSVGYIINYFYIFTFPLIGVTAFYALRKFGVGRLLAIFGSVLYAYLPEHMYRNINHLTLGNYFMVPIVAVILLWIMKGELLQNQDGASLGSGRNIFSGLKNRKMIFAVICCFIFGMTDLYYAFFSCIFLAFAGIYIWTSTKQFRNCLPAILLIFIFIIGIGVTLIPYFLVSDNSSYLFSSSGRVYNDTENYALKLSYLLFPISEHRIDAFARFTQDYMANTGLHGEEKYAALGTIGAFGFLYSIFIVVFNKLSKADKKIELFGKFNLFAVLLSIAGGGSLIIAMFLTSSIRCYNRTSVYIAIFSIAVVCLLLQEIQKKIKKKGIMALFLAGVILLGCWGIYDQTGYMSSVDFSSNKAQYYNDDNYVKQIESIEPKNAMILAMPVFTGDDPQYYMPDNKMNIYEIRRLYLHSDTLRWNFSYDMGTPADKWQYYVGTQDVGDMLQDLAFAGFSGISIDKYAYTDSQYATLESGLEQYLKVTPIHDQMNRYSFFDMTQYVDTLRSQYTSDEWNAKNKQVLDMVYYTLGSGFYPVETNQQGNWFVWSQRQSSISVMNSGNFDRNVQMSMNIATFYKGPYQLTVTVNGQKQTIQIDSSNAAYKLNLQLKPGKNTVQLSTDAPSAKPADLRGENRDHLVFQMSGLQFK
jgi:hypothetical protein